MASQEEDNKLECISNVNKEQERYFLNVYKLPCNLIATHQVKLLHEIEKAQNELLKLNSGFATRCKKLADVVKNPWEDPVLMTLMKTKEADIGPAEIEFFCVETAYVVSVRLKKLCESQCEDLALNLVTAFMNCNKLSKTQNFSLNATETQMWFIFDIYIALLYKFQERQKIVVLLKELKFEEGLQLVKRFAKKRVKISKIWKNCHRVAVLATQMYISQAVVKYTEDLQAILESYIDIYISICNTEHLLQDFTTSIRRISNLADAAGLYVFCAVIQKKAGTKLKPFVIEMYIRALTTDMNELERQKDANETEKVTATTSRLAAAFCNLADFLDEHVKVARECVLTAFSLEPTKERLKNIETLATRSGFQVLDTGQEWKCRLHPPVLPSDDIAWICPECGDWMCKPQLNIPLKINMALHEALQNSVLGISEALCDDLVVCLSNPRYQILSWFLPWDDLHRLCIMYLQDPQTTKNFITELKFVDIDYSIFKGIKREPLDELAGIERGYEQYLDQDFVSDEETSSVSEDSMSQDSRPYSLGSDGAGEGPYLPLLPLQPKSDPNTLKSLRMFRPNLKRSRTNETNDNLPEKLLKADSNPNSINQPHTITSHFKEPSSQNISSNSLSNFLNGISTDHLPTVTNSHIQDSDSKNVKAATLPPLGGQVARKEFHPIQVKPRPLLDTLYKKGHSSQTFKTPADQALKPYNQSNSTITETTRKDLMLKLLNKLSLSGSKENNNHKVINNHRIEKISDLSLPSEEPKISIKPSTKFNKESNTATITIPTVEPKRQQPPNLGIFLSHNQDKLPTTASSNQDQFQTSRSPSPKPDQHQIKPFDLSMPSNTPCPHQDCRQPPLRSPILDHLQNTHPKVAKRPATRAISPDKVQNILLQKIPLVPSPKADKMQNLDNVSLSLDQNQNSTSLNLDRNQKSTSPNLDQNQNSTSLNSVWVPHNIPPYPDRTQNIASPNQNQSRTVISPILDQAQNQNLPPNLGIIQKPNPQSIISPSSEKMDSPASSQLERLPSANRKQPIPPPKSDQKFIVSLNLNLLSNLVCPRNPEQTKDVRLKTSCSRLTNTENRIHDYCQKMDNQMNDVRLIQGASSKVNLSDKNGCILDKLDIKCNNIGKCGNSVQIGVTESDLNSNKDGVDKIEKSENLDTVAQRQVMSKNCLGVIDDGIFSDLTDNKSEEMFFQNNNDYSSFVKDASIFENIPDEELPKNFNLTENIRTYTKKSIKKLPVVNKDCVKTPTGVDDNLDVCKNVNSSNSVQKPHSNVQKPQTNHKELKVVLYRLPLNTIQEGQSTSIKEEYPSFKKCDRGKTPPKGARRRKSTDKSENKIDKAPNRVQSHIFSPPQLVNARITFKENSKLCCDDLAKPNKVLGASMIPRVLLERIHVDNRNYARSVLANVPGLNDYQMIRPTNVNHIVNVVQVSGGRSSQNVPIQNTQTSTQVSPHIQRIGQPRVADQKPEHSNSIITSTTTLTTTTTTAKTTTTQPSTLINILSQQIIRPVTTQTNTVRRQTPLINILSQQIIRPSQTQKTTANSGVATSENNQVKPTVTTEQTVNSQGNNAVKNASMGIKTTNNPATTGQGGTILQFICKSTLPKFQQAFGKSVYQNNTETSSTTTSTIETTNVASDSKKNITKTVPVNVQPIQGSVIYSRQMPVGQTISLIPPGGTTRQVFRIATSNSEQISLVKDSVIHSKMSALLAAALQGRPKNSESDQVNSDEKITITRPTLVQNARIVKPVQLQIPPNVVRAAPNANLSSTTLEQLREFDMVYKQIKERSSTTTPAEASNSPPENQEVTQQRISVTYVNQLQKYTQLSPVVVVSNYSSLQPAASPALSVTSQGSSSPCVTPAPTPTLPKMITTKSSKGKTLKTTTTSSTAKSSPIPKPQQKPQEDEHTTQRIFDILAEYAEQLRNSPDLNNKPAPRRRSNPPTNPSQNSKRKKSSSGSKKSGQSGNSIEIDGDDITVGSEDSSGGGIVQLSVTDDEQSQAATINTPESTENSSPSSSRQLILTESSTCGNQSRNLIIADSSVGEALKIPNTAVIVPGSYIMPVSMVKGGQQIAVVSGGSKILATVPARSGQNMLLFQSFMNQNRKGAISAVKYSAIQPITGISSQSLAGVSAQPPVILPSNSVATAVALGHPLTLKKLNDDRDNNELLLTISHPKENSKRQSDIPQPDSSTSVSSDSNDIKIEDSTMQSDNSNEKIFQSFQKSVITNSVATSTNNNEQKTFRSNTTYYTNKSKKNSADSQKMDSEMQKQAAIERELRLQKSLSEECEDLGVDEPSTSDLFPEADLLFDSNHSPSFDQSSQDVIKRTPQSNDIKEEVKGAMNLFSDDENSSSLRTDLFEYVEYQTVETALDYQARQLMNGNTTSNESGSSGCEDNTLLAKCATMSEVTLNSPISPEMYTENSLNKYKFKYSNRKKGERIKQNDFGGEIVSSSEDTIGSTELGRNNCEEDNFKVVHVAITKTDIVKDEEKCELHCHEDLDSPSGRGARRSVRKLCSCCNGSQDGNNISRKRPHSSRPHTPAAPHKKAFLSKKR
ncbi:hypothetical protein NQ314_020745 [Rhamnusium bicolor]|uniref:Zinc finger protein Rlf/292/654 TPR repeats domain-containing protein n=1 Tax=Rhamnusium bicolor TaxID=1586634 RepID=A0AAV8WKP4_9CUCU|nr:hypothetical protein NQ314_020745 [Rhamnusium bicolor]